MVPVTAVRLTWGTALTVLPDVVLRSCPRTTPSRAGRAVVRALGARHLVQGLATARGTLPTAWAAVPDALHAASMAGLALHSRRWRTAALIDCLVAGAFAVGTIRSTRASAPAAAHPSPAAPVP
ncbi:hypothetical protein C1I97_15340 [Streptomyces sp. NTH33]|uniref:hypothetical protein n=1 Tax=Streptomyces sp. NTH33 TaxID=1735453 RepID=UPI000DA89B85|nr:hypothetical protein [Streptomyces sp. NTH33]PZH09021.1 hypothetical protein C1I97_15340 [Streptomyces sp. NTH33]